MGPATSSIVSIIPLTFSATSPPKQSKPSSDLLSILPLRHNQPPTSFSSSTNNLPLVGPKNHIPSANPSNNLSNIKQHQPAKQPKNQSTSATSSRASVTNQHFSHPRHNSYNNQGTKTDFDNKRQQRDYYRKVNHVAIEGPITQTKWSYIPITFTAQDVNLVPTY
jgi:hypothetical protein